MYNKILVALDTSDDFNHIAETIIDIAKNKNTKVVLFHSLDNIMTYILPTLVIPVGYSSTLLSTNYMENRREIEDNAKQLLEDTKKLFVNEKIDVESRLITDESPEDYITRAIDEEGFDLVVLSCKGDHSSFKRAFSETIPLKILNDGRSDVLVIR
jgi:nucleotide-binding universal stress UspA family protein